ncbi:phosphoribosylanthranilate isomerase [Synechococcus sp. CC9311]|uniref:phosphoribosylanthranilate isomerase n=1 Tax=Synechococcus sp. (strain CC9311) TaxID=64471 RepID=UPI0000DDB0A6|nr:phosphoribosylanthranilate isomerase [Synechococcus sp. CC9311]ABI47853.1 N-(5'phosphoribosyl)anthranilate isomerase [Synechococcus sp. CC9311]
MSDAAIALKICGLTDHFQACFIAAMGAQAIGVIGVDQTPRFVEEPRRRFIFMELEKLHPTVERVWVVADPSDHAIGSALQGEGTPTVVQLHGSETPERCIQLKQRHPKVRWWKALKLRTEHDLSELSSFEPHTDALLLDAWSPDQLGGTGHRLNPSWFTHLHDQLKPNTVWWLAGGISAEWVPELLSLVSPYGLDASSRLESQPGVKDLNKVRALVQAVHDNEPLRQ